MREKGIMWGISRLLAYAHFFKRKHVDFQHLEAVGLMKAVSVNFLAKDLPSRVFFKLLRTSAVCNG